MEISFKFKLLFIMIYFILILILERIYNKKLFNISLDIIPKFQIKSSSFDSFWKIMTFFGTKPGIGPFYIILFLFIPLNKVFTLVFLLLFTGFIDHTFKLVYLQQRPLWVNNDIDTGTRHACGYGNPSGHSLSSSCLYLSFWYFISQIIDSNVINNFIRLTLKYTILILNILFFLTIMISRLYLGVHSLNQIVFGFSLGLGIFLLFLPVLEIYQNSGTEFLSKQYLYRYKQLLFIIFWIAFFYIFYFCREDIEKVKESENWEKMCFDQKWSKLLIKASFMGGMSIFIILGMNIGLLFSKRKIDIEFNSKEEIIINWEKSGFSPRIIRLLFLIIGFSPVGIIFLMNTLFNLSYILYYILTPIIFFLGGFLSFGPFFIFGFKFVIKRFDNSQLYSINNRDNTQVIDCSNEIFN